MKIVREPLVHFLLLGAAIFAVYGLATRHEPERPGEILVTQGTIENLATGFQRTWQRPPTGEELAGLLREHIREEVAYREALALGLDRDDMIVRRRLRQKLEFVSDALVDRSEPSEEQLQAFLEGHRSLFESEPSFSFRQVYFDPQRHPEGLQQDLARALDHLRHAPAHTDAALLGDPFLLEQQFEKIPVSDLTRTFGEPFASAISVLPVGVWRGPITSGYGAHLVLVIEHTNGQLPRLAEVRDQVRREFVDIRRREATDRYYRELLEKRYTVRIEPAVARVAELQ